MVTVSCLAQKGGVHEQWLHSPHSCESTDCPDTVPINMGELTGTKSHLSWVHGPLYVMYISAKIQLQRPCFRIGNAVVANKAAEN